MQNFNPIQRLFIALYLMILDIKAIIIDFKDTWYDMTNVQRFWAAFAVGLFVFSFIMAIYG